MSIELNTSIPASETPASSPRKRGLDVYTWMLILSLLLVTAGCGMLVLELAQYDFQWRPVNF